MNEETIYRALEVAVAAVDFVQRVAVATLTTECPECGRDMKSRKRVLCPACRAKSDYDPERISEIFDDWIQEARRILER